MTRRELVQQLNRLLAAGEYAAALPYAEQLRERFPEDPLGIVALARIYAVVYPEALPALLREALERFPRHAALLQHAEHVMRAERSREHAEHAAHPTDLASVQAVEPDVEPATAAEEHAAEPGVQPPTAVEEHTAGPAAATPLLRLVEAAGSETVVRLRSAIVRLIPGLEFAPLRLSSPAQSSPRIAEPLLPPFPNIRVSEEAMEPEELSPLELLARRLKQARIPPRSEPEESLPTEPPPEPETAPTPMVLTETMARIYEQQGAYEQALHIYEELCRREPHRRTEYERAIARLRERLSDAHR